jgi:hypothetical protein
MPLEELPAGWTVWNEEPEGRVILAYRPDVFDADAFPAPCLPTIHVSNGSLRRRPGAGQLQSDTWHARLLLEPEIECGLETFDTRADAIDGALELARRFVDGEIDYRAAYQVPRPAYLDRLDELVAGSD